MRAVASELPRGWFSKGDIERYRYIYQNLIPENGFTAEVGCYLGRSICSVADIVQRRGLKVFCVDRWQPWEIDKSEDQLQQFMTNCHNAGIFDGASVILQAGPSVVVSKMFDPASLDFVFIDADHEYESVKADIEAWLPKVKPGGWLGGHDFPDFIGVARAVGEMLSPVETSFDSTIWLYRKLA